MPIFTRIKALAIVILMGISPITYCAEENHDGDKQANKRNISAVNPNPQENGQLTKKQKLHSTPLEMDEYFSNEVYLLIFHFLNGETRVESNFILTCKNWNALADYYYEKINNLKQIYQWQGHTLHNRTLNIFNGHMLTVLGLSINARDQLINKKDSAIFKQRCEHITRAPFFAYSAIPIQYVRLLLLHNKLPGIYEMPCLEDLAKSLKGDLTQELTHIANNNSLGAQNESYIYFDFIYQFYNDGYSNIKSTPLFSKINCFFGRLLNDELLDLKKTPNLDDSPQFAHAWKKIIALDPVPTLWMLKKGGHSICFADSLNGLTYLLAYKIALQSIGEKTSNNDNEMCMNCGDEAIEDLKKKPESTPEEFENLGRLCDELESFVNAGECFFEALKIKENLQEKPTPDDYKKLGKYMLKYNNDWLASDVYLRAFKAILSLGQIPTSEDCKNVVDLVTFSEDANYGEEALLLFQQRITYMENLGQTPSPEDYMDLQKIHVKTSDLCYYKCMRNNGKDRSEELLNKASNHVILALKTMTLSKQRPELEDYLGPLYPYNNENRWFTVTTKNIVEAEHHYQNLKSSGLEIPEEVKNWGENLEKYYNSAEIYRQQMFAEQFRKNAG